MNMFLDKSFFSQNKFISYYIITDLILSAYLFLEVLFVQDIQYSNDLKGSTVHPQYNASLIKRLKYHWMGSVVFSKPEYSNEMMDSWQFDARDKPKYLSKMIVDSYLEKKKNQKPINLLKIILGIYFHKLCHFFAIYTFIAFIELGATPILLKLMIISLTADILQWRFYYVSALYIILIYMGNVKYYIANANAEKIGRAISTSVTRIVYHEITEKQNLPLINANLIAKCTNVITVDAKMLGEFFIPITECFYTFAQITLIIFCGYRYGGNGIFYGFAFLIIASIFSIQSMRKSKSINVVFYDQLTFGSYVSK